MPTASRAARTTSPISRPRASATPTWTTWDTRIMGLAAPARDLTSQDSLDLDPPRPQASRTGFPAPRPVCSQQTEPQHIRQHAGLAHVLAEMRFPHEAESLVQL